MSRAKFYKYVFDEHCKLTCNGEGGGGVDEHCKLTCNGEGGEWGDVTILVLI